MWNKIQEMFAATSSATLINSQVSLRDSLNELRTQWNSLNNELNSVKSHLNTSRIRWEDFFISHENLVKWLKKMTEDVNKNYNHKGELSEMKTLLEK